ncbi:MAG: hypothetical protein DSZ06_04635, partial [Sulfurospirillum sp.]
MRLSTVLINMMALTVLVSGCGSNGTAKKSINNNNTTEQEQAFSIKTVNKAPLASNVKIDTAVNNSSSLTLTSYDPDKDTLEYEIVSQPEHGEITRFNKKNGTFVYKPDDNFKGVDKFQYCVSDGVSKSDIKTVTIDVDNQDDITVPNAPSDLVAKAGKCNSIDIKWSDNSDNEDGFEIYIERYDEDGDYVEEDSWLEMVADKDATEATLWGLKTNSTYKIIVKAKNAAGSSEGTTAEINIPKVTTKPDAPTNLRVKNVGENCVRLVWDDEADNEEGYEIYKDGELVKKIDADCECVLIGDLNPDETYHFKIRAFNDAGYSESLSIDATTKAITVDTNPNPDTDTDPKPQDKHLIITTSGNQIITLGESAFLKISTKSDAKIVKYEWKEGDKVLGSGATLEYKPETDGEHIIIVTVTDDKGSTDSSIIKVNVKKKEEPKPDTTKPIIILNGARNITIKEGDTFKDPGATASDNKDGDITNKITTSGTVDSSKAGTYTITYSVKDNAGNSASITRTVKVEKKPDTTKPDTTKPIIILNGARNITITEGDSFKDPGATASDNKDGDITNKIKTSGTVDNNKAGTYTITYSVKDNAGNSASVTRTVKVEKKPDTTKPDTTKPVITLKGSNPIRLTEGDSFKDPGATASDNKDGDITNKITTSGTVNTSKVGTYIITYSVKDSAGNSASITRTVIVEKKADTTKPIIILNGARNITIKEGDSFTDPGATASDNEDGDITNKITTSGTVDTNKAGTYTITYSVTDSAGNSASITRTVKVEKKPDTTKPTITLKGSNPITITEGDSF